MVKNSSEIRGFSSNIILKHIINDSHKLKVYKRVTFAFGVYITTLSPFLKGWKKKDGIAIKIGNK